MSEQASLCLARIASDEPCACDRYPYCGCGRKRDDDAQACDALDEAIYEQTGRHPADG
jgi:hypothetical protein